eukprot:8900890-Alexandrium_andersonii.AAC.1
MATTRNETPQYYERGYRNKEPGRSNNGTLWANRHGGKKGKNESDDRCAPVVAPLGRSSWGYDG